MSDYQQFLERKRISDPPTGIEPGELNLMLYPFQRDITAWALKRGRAAIFADCGLGKTPMQAQWAANVPGNVLIAAPLAVAHQTVREGAKFGVSIRYARRQADARPGITVTNYQMLEQFDPSYFTGFVADESSILKNYTGHFRNMIIERFGRVPFRLACTATPAPNDFMELGNHAEFVGAMSRTEMLAMFFIHDGSETQQWRLKGHAESDFWRWLCSWAVMMRRPSDLGYEDGAFTLPPLNMAEHIVGVDHADSTDGMLFRMQATTLQERRDERRRTIQQRARMAADLATATDRPFLCWCDLNDESSALAKLIPGAVEVRGSWRG